MNKLFILNKKIEDVQLVETLEALLYEIESRKYIIQSMLNMDEINKENFAQYHAEYQYYFKQYEQAKTIFYNSYVAHIVNDLNINIDWNLDFATSSLTIKEVNNGCCNNKKGD